jgi:2-iminobutanoate/2-iminopropanoate deaminase
MDSDLVPSGGSDVERPGRRATRLTILPTLNAVYARHFQQPWPARTNVTVAALPLGALVKIDLIARA